MAYVKYQAIEAVKGPLVYVRNYTSPKLGEIIRINVGKEIRHGQILEILEDISVVQVFEGTSGITRESTVEFSGNPMQTRVSEEVLGRVFDGMGRPKDDGLPLRGKLRSIQGFPINPSARSFPREFIETGISAVDGLLSIVRGQKLPIFSVGGLPHNVLAAQIIRQARLRRTNEGFAVFFVAIGITQEEADFFIHDFSQAGVMSRTTLFLNLASDPPIERLLVPRIALTQAEYLAFEKNYHILVVMLDITNYCESLREVSMARGETPGRRGYPGYTYTDLASLYERAGKIQGRGGSITMIPILTMPDNDITHPIPDLTGFITEGQIVLSPDLHQRRIYPPIDVLPSLSRLMKDGIGPGQTREDHKELVDRLYSAYARGRSAMDLALVVGKDALTNEERALLKFADLFEQKFVSQDPYERRSIEQTLDLGKQILKVLE
ncbi:MAG: V-type ATP synthase subunit B [Candidatus Ranarchaeia archaeon]